MKHIRHLISVLLVLVMVFSMMAIQASAADDSRMLAQAKQGIVRIMTEAYSDSGEFIGDTLGSGFAVGIAGEDSDIFITSWCVVTCNGMASLDHTRTYILPASSSEDYERGPVECEVLYVSKGNPDLAIVRALEPLSDIKALPLMSSNDAADGTRIYALGYPSEVADTSEIQLGIDDITVSTGSISQQTTYTSNDIDTRVILHDAPIQYGNSGGPLLTSKGTVIGINTYDADNTAGFDASTAVCIDYAMEKMDTLGLTYDVSSPSRLGLNTPVIIAITIALAAVVVLVVLVLRLTGSKKSRRSRRTAHAAQE